MDFAPMHPVAPSRGFPTCYILCYIVKSLAHDHPIPLIRPYQCDYEGGRIRGVLLYDWQMHFNPQKCFVMRLTQARHLTRFNYILGDKSVQEADIHPYLGVHITKYLTWNKHSFIRCCVHCCGLQMSHVSFDYL